jgi:alkanesulfonate monooxygenase SsuD/methylene tetrahydromethanopterin reductase-like flavin-dependent oxidoreductase (luciferase family)
VIQTKVRRRTSAARTPAFGVFVDYRLPVVLSVTPSAWWARLHSLVEYLEELRYDFVWLGEHHFAAEHFTTSPLLSLASLVPITSRLRLGAMILALPLHHPLRVAEEAATIDVLSGGRLDLGVALGYREIEFAGFGVSRCSRTPIFEESLEIIGTAWGPRRMSFAGRHYSIPELEVFPKPHQQPEPPIFVAARMEAAAGRAGRLGLHLSDLGAPGVPEAYAKALEGRGLDPGDRFIAVYRPFFISTRPADDYPRLSTHFSAYHGQTGAWMEGSPDLQADHEAIKSRGERPLESLNYLFGTPEHALEDLKRHYTERPFTHLHGLMGPPLETNSLNESLRLFAHEVVEPFK